MTPWMWTWLGIMVAGAGSFFLDISRWISATMVVVGALGFLACLVLVGISTAHG